jgi:hypothetical protein
MPQFLTTGNFNSEVDSQSQTSPYEKQSVRGRSILDRLLTSKLEKQYLPSIQQKSRGDS